MGNDRLYNKSSCDDHYRSHCVARGRGIQTAAFLNDLLVIMKLGVIVLFIGFGIAYIKADNLTPFIPANTGEFGEFGWSGILRGAGVALFRVLGL